jgi:SAM-dependent methyltransferase
MSVEHSTSREAMWLLAALTLSAVLACAGAGTSSTSPAHSVSDSTGQTDASAPVVTAAVMPDVDYWATPQPIVDKMLELAQVLPSDVVYDLGCGDARSLVTAAQRYGAKGVGFDIDPRLVVEARENVRRHGVEQLVKIEQGDIFTLDLSAADVIFLYITPRFNLRLVPQFEKMKKGSRIVSHEFEIPGAKPTRTVHVRGPADGPPDADQPASTVTHTIYLWKLPWQKQWTDWKLK